MVQYRARMNESEVPISHAELFLLQGFLIILKSEMNQSEVPLSFTETFVQAVLNWKSEHNGS
jgi:hypothetical protein